ncbi:TIGR02530 family flagellar biosynthesis protein [Sporolactobacillus putidus]|uniref:Flagellar operon protein n=1 Tax=Sporolactobacillus putidus TaxID=492735 RepID=A0A917RY86_9BACL|nr:TIGR02530 family flagellar biosynthesis protein [Sporolactobacillus putidus]GGL44072.1 hypothetical protein GCM10007968_05030 [Sporolactobacillus putidus]
MNPIERYAYYPPSVVGEGAIERRTDSDRQKESSSFKQTLTEELNQLPVKLTKHAKDRFIQRNIHLSSQDWNQIYLKMKQAGKMGIGDSLVLTRKAALVVNAPRNMVITAMDLQEASSHIFTNINGTIVINH